GLRFGSRFNRWKWRQWFAWPRDQRVPLGMPVRLGGLQGRGGIAKRLLTDRTCDVGRIEVGERIDRRMWNCGAYRIRQAERRRMNSAERRGDQMLLPAFGDARLTGKQGAEILKRSPLGRHYEQRRCNGGRCGSPSPPTPKRNCYPFAQRHTATPCDRPAAGWRQCDRFFYGPINL